MENGKAKGEARKEFLTRLSRLGREEKRAQSAAICSHLSSFLTSSDSILAYSALDSEPELGPFLDRALRSKRTVALPRIEGGHLVFHLVSDLSDVIDRHALGMKEPLAESPTWTPVDTVLVLIPGLGFGRDGSRLGRGKGYYDRFLRTLPSGARKIGVAFETQWVETLPVEAHDVRLDGVVTPSGLHLI